MSTSKTWPGGATTPSPTSYSIPASGELNWANLSDFLIALADSAQGTGFQKFAIRKATTTPVTVAAASDCVVVTDLSVAGAVTVNLPAGANKQVFMIVDGKGDAATNNITINRAGSDTIAGATSAVLNQNREGIILVFNSGDTDWKIVGRTSGAGFLTNPMDSAGDMIYGGASGVATKLDAGTAGNWLLSGGAGSPVWSNSTATGKTIDGSADEVQLTVQGNGTQTSNLFVCENSAGTDVFTVTNGGIITAGIAAGTGTHVIEGTTARMLSNVNGGGLEVRRSNNANIAVIEFRNAAGTVLFSFQQAATGSDALNILSGATTVGSISSVGAYTLGASGSTSNHQFEGTTLRMLSNTNGGGIEARRSNNSNDTAIEFRNAAGSLLFGLLSPSGATSGLQFRNSSNATVGTISDAGIWTFTTSIRTAVAASGGNASSPIITPSDDTNTGIYYSADVFGLSAGGNSGLEVRSGGVIFNKTGTGPAGVVDIYGDTNTPTANEIFTWRQLDGSVHVYNGNSNGAATGESGTAAILKVRQDSSTSRSINAAGTVNASGADYAEYVKKANVADVIAKGEVCGINKNGLLTKNFSKAHTFVVKSTDPAYVGGDRWGAKFEVPEKPAKLYKEPADGDEDTREKYRKDKEDHDRKSAKWVEDYKKFNDDVEAERVKWDRIAFCGQVPCIVTGDFEPGDWIIPQEGPNDEIVAVAVKDRDLSFDQYKKTIGKVWKADKDGKAIISVGLK